MTPAHHSTSAGRASRTCSRTGLRLAPATGQPTYRVASSSHGPANPQLRKSGFDDVQAWARWDTAPGRTIYSADTPVFAYQEVLAYPADSLKGTSSDQTFSEPAEPEDNPGLTVLEHIEQEWDAAFASFTPGKVPARWRTSRRLHKITLPTSGSFIDITHQDSLTALNRVGGFINLNRRATATDLTGENRDWTCHVATVLRQLILDDGSLAHGIRYLSKHGANGGCWAFWMRQTDDGLDLAQEPIVVDLTGLEIRDIEHNPDLRAAADHLGVTVY